MHSNKIQSNNLGNIQSTGPFYLRKEGIHLSVEGISQFGPAIFQDR